MSSIAHKKQLSLTLPRTIRGAVADGRQIEGQAWPCHVVSVEGAIVTVAFDVGGDFTLPQVTCPIAESFYVLLPVQVGDTGMVIAAGARLGGVTELGAGVAPLALPSNLGALVFIPLGRKSWVLPDSNAVIVQGPNGAIVRTINGDATVTINETNISVDWKGKTIVIDSAGITLTATQNTINGDLTVNGDVTVSGNTTLLGDVALNGTFTSLGPLFGINATTIALVGDVEITGSLSINGHDFSSHHHSSNATDGPHQTGGVVP